MKRDFERVAYVFLCIVPFLNLVAASARGFRPEHVPIGLVLFLLIAAAAWAAGGRVLFAGPEGSRQIALAGVALLLPFALIALMWAGIGAPFQATLSENHMRFVVLVADSILVTIGFVALWAALHDGGERLLSTLGLGASLVAGTAYFVCLNVSLGQVALRVHGDKTPLPPHLGSFYNGVEFFACLMTYVTIVLFAGAMGRARLLGRGASIAYAATSAVLAVFLVMRGFEYPEISGRTAPWYTQPGVIAGIPAIPWLLPTLMAAVLIRRAGTARA